MSYLETINICSKLYQPGFMNESRTQPFVSIIIPCRNEEQFIAETLNSVISQDYPKDKMEVLVVDGQSEDLTQSIVKDFINKYPFIRLLENKRKFTPSAMNLGIRAAKGDMIIRIDAHCLYPKDYVSSLIDWMAWLDADNVGAVLETKPYVNTLNAEAVSIVMSHPFGVGNAYFRVGIKLPKLVDTVPFGCFKKDIFNKIGMYDEDLLRGEDNELNSRLEMAGGKIFLVPDFKVTYFSRANLFKAWKMYYQYGYCRPYVNLKLGKPATLRQFVPMAFFSSMVLCLAFSLIYPPLFLIAYLEYLIYVAALLYFSSVLSVRRNKLELFPFLFIGFVGVHFMYGYGYLKALWEILLLRRKTMAPHTGATMTR